jgi:hypothetical protein
MIAMKATLISLVLLSAITARGQSPVTASTGADGALELTTPGIVIFNPRSFNPPLNPSEDNVFQFTTIHIGKDVTVKLTSKNLNGPVFWLASGSVQIDGTIDLNGDDGGLWPSLAGAGGYPGGAPRKAGYGPAGFTLNSFLVPLVGGSGGSGGESQGGGAGGGALLIASRTSITVSGKIIANGGSSSNGSGGSGGAIRLVAPVIDGSGGTLSARGGQPSGSDGAIRFESNDNRFEGTVNSGHVFHGKPLGLFLPPNPPASVRVVSIGGVLMTTQKFTISEPSLLTVAVEAHNIPVGTVVDLQCFSESGQDQTVESSPLTGTMEHSWATALVSFPKGASRCLAAVAWTPPPSR